MGRFIDRSNNNGLDDLKRAGVTHLYAKTTEGSRFADSTFTARRFAALRAGARFGGYHFSDLGDPDEEASFFLARVGKPAVGQLRPCLDLERGQVISDVAWAERWIRHAHSVLGYYPALYGSTSLIAPMRDRSALIRSCPWWRAEYGPNDGRLHALQGGTLGAAAHQYTSVAVFPGVSGRTDASVLLHPTALLVPRPGRAPLPTMAWTWARWYLGIGEYAGHRHDMRVRPRVPLRVPASWWRAVRWYTDRSGQ